MTFDMPTPEQIFEERTREIYEHVRDAENAAATDDAPQEPADTTPYTYGPPAAVPRETNYISDENLLLWLAEKQDGLYADLHERMDLSRDRSKLMEDLSHIKERIEAGNLTPQQAYDEVTALLQSYEGSPFGPALEALFGPLLDDLGRALPTSDGVFAEAAALPLSIEQAKEIADSIKSHVDALGRDDQLALIEIQSLTADINQAAQLASNLLSSSNQTQNAILGNIGR
jgi:hypothetical protein